MCHTSAGVSWRRSRSPDEIRSLRRRPVYETGVNRGVAPAYHHARQARPSHPKSAIRHQSPRSQQACGLPGAPASRLRLRSLSSYIRSSIVLPEPFGCAIASGPTRRRRLRIRAATRQSANWRRMSGSAALRPRFRIASRANSEQEQPPYNLRCAQTNPLYGDIHRW